MAAQSMIEPLIITFNCGRELVKPVTFSTHIASKFPNASPELLVFALEEVAPIAYSYLGGSFLVPYFERIKATAHLVGQKWGGQQYTNLLTRNVGMTALMIFARADVTANVTDLEAGGVGVGWSETGNKGAVAIRLGYKNSDSGTTRLTFVAAHLAPMENALQRRNKDWEDIVRGLVLVPVKKRRPSSSLSASSEAEHEPLLGDSSGRASSSEVQGLYSYYADIPTQHTTCSHLILAGDLNYRTSGSPPRPASRAMFPRLSVEEDSPQHYGHLLPSDQLHAEMASKRTLHGFEEAQIEFPPTYKYSKPAQKHMEVLEEGDLKMGSRRDEGADLGHRLSNPPMDWPWSGHRWPSWCDRILWLPMPGSAADGHGDQIRSLAYTSLPLMSTSDHQPVALHLSIPLKPVRLAPGSSDVRQKPPFGIHPDWRERRDMARRKEVAVGVGAYFSTTHEGQAILLAIVLGAVGGWTLVARILNQ